MAFITKIEASEQLKLTPNTIADLGGSILVRQSISGSTFFSGSTNLSTLFIHNQNVAPQVGNFNINGTAKAKVFNLGAEPVGLSGSPVNYIYGGINASDWFKIYGESPVEDLGHLVFEIGDNNPVTNPSKFKFRFFDNTAGTPLVDAFEVGLPYSKFFGRVKGSNAVADDEFITLGQGMGSFLPTSGGTITGSIKIEGNLFFTGSATTINRDVVQIADNIITLNKGEILSGVTAGSAGIEIDRGLLPKYQLVFDEPTDRLKAGFIGSLQNVATIEDSPVNGSLLSWNNTTKRLESSTKNYIENQFAAPQSGSTWLNGQIRISRATQHHIILDDGITPTTNLEVCGGPSFNGLIANNAVLALTTTGGYPIYLSAGSIYNFGTAIFSSTGGTANSHSNAIEFQTRNSAGTNNNATRIRVLGSAGDMRTMDIDAHKVVFNSSHSIKLPKGGTGTVVAPTEAEFRYNDTIKTIEYHNGTTWIQSRDGIWNQLTSAQSADAWINGRMRLQNLEFENANTSIGRTSFVGYTNIPNADYLWMKSINMGTVVGTVSQPVYISSNNIYFPSNPSGGVSTDTVLMRNPTDGSLKALPATYWLTAATANTDYIKNNTSGTTQTASYKISGLGEMSNAVLGQAIVSFSQIDFNVGVQYKDIISNTTFTMTNGADGKGCQVLISNTSGSAVTFDVTGATFTTIVNKSIAAGKKVILSLMRINGATYAAIVGEY